jgi:ubiquinone/menaquinone biosynthesis C-methylase UbiE
MNIHIHKEIQGLILDIGGGGEGVISRLYPGQVIAIDKSPEELNEAPNLAVKIVMDAGKMAFTDNCFENVTAFYTFMYMDKSEHRAVASEIKRVLKSKGRLHLWDAEISEANPFIAGLDITINDLTFHTDYGVYKDDAAQDAEYFKQLFEVFGLTLIKETSNSGHFYQCWEKQLPQSP